MKRRKKYSFGTGNSGTVKSYIEDPSTTLAKHNIGLSKAGFEAETSDFGKGLGMFGNLATVAGTSIAGGSSGVMSGGKEGFMNMFSSMFGKKQTAAYGGKIGSKVEVEGEEVGETPEGELLAFKGPSHEKGGIDVTLPEGTEIFSKRIKVGGKTMAERKKIREGKTLSLEKLLEKNKADTVLTNTLKRTKQTNASEEKKDQDMQEFVGAMEEMVSYAFGTGSKGIPKMKLGGPVDPFELYNSLLNQDFEGKSTASVAPVGAYSEASLDVAKTKQNNDQTDSSKEILDKLPNFGIGDLTVLGGAAYSTFAPMENVEANRAGDQAAVNSFKDFGKDGIEKLEQAQGYVAGQRDKALGDVETARVRTTAGNRNSARGVNTMRALDLASEVNANKADGDIYDNFAKQMMGLVGQQAGFEMEQDKAVMSGEAQRIEDDNAARDNYFSQMAEAISSKGEGFQQIGKMLNKNKANTVAENAISESSKNFKYTNGVITDKNGNKVSDAEIDRLALEEGISRKEYLKKIKKV